MSACTAKKVQRGHEQPLRLFGNDVHSITSTHLLQLVAEAKYGDEGHTHYSTILVCTQG